MKFEKEVGFLLAYIFGNISPKINITKVMSKISKQKFNQKGSDSI